MEITTGGRPGGDVGMFGSRLHCFPAPCQVSIMAAQRCNTLKDLKASDYFTSSDPHLDQSFGHNF